MSDATATLYFDFIDPLSFLLELELGTLPRELTSTIASTAFELRPPPAPLVLVDDPTLASRWGTAREVAASSGVSLAPPRLVPWSRKAHELHRLADAHGVAAPVRSAIFESYHLEGRDIGRVDLLVEIGRAAGLDATETKAALDVDRFEAEVAESRRLAESAGVTGPPTLVRGSGAARLEGFHNRTALSTFLRPSQGA